ncbi:NAD(P)/FAD-dependent oxidoreductase [Actinokineospora guangxiensis]|uniref:NAD(P)/FAD-dependent oxidoreductase n=1 Tax=Actinokineospora guangxiensis TaxID=1490288 RepID=A0ABW0EZ77_9PSEU
MKVVVVGAGISGLACGRRLAEAGVSVRVVERARVVGGRLATRRFDGRAVDFGAPYFTVRDDDFAKAVDGLHRSGLVRRWTDTLAVIDPKGRRSTSGPVRWAATAGLRSVAEHLAEGLRVDLERRVERVGPGPSVDGDRVDAVVLAMPGPQAARLLDPDSSANRAVESQRWLPSLAAVLRYADRAWPDFDGAFVNDDPVLTTVFDDGARRGDGSPVAVAYTTDAFAQEHLDAPTRAAGAIAAAASRAVGLPEPVDVHVHRWTFARPAQDGARSFHWDDQGIGVCGDAWGSPRVETAWLSGTSLAARILAAR